MHSKPRWRLKKKMDNVDKNYEEILSKNKEL